MPLSPLLAEDSPLRKLPRGLEPRLLVPLDCARLSLEMAHLSWLRLHSALVRFPGYREAPDWDRHLVLSGLLLDAWSLVETAEKVRALLLKFLAELSPYPDAEKGAWKEIGRGAPVDRAPGPSSRRFLSGDSQIRLLRNHSQHLAGRSELIGAKGYFTLGVLRWLHLPEGTSRRAPVRQYSFASGVTGRKLEMIWIGRIPPEIRYPVDRVELITNGQTLDLGNLIAELKAVACEFEELLENLHVTVEGEGELTYGGGDLLVEYRLDWAGDRSRTEKKKGPGA